MIGKTGHESDILFGKIIEEMDCLAADCCYKYMISNDD